VTPSVGGFNAVVEVRGSRYATDGVMKGWMPVPGDGRSFDRIQMLVGGRVESVAEVSYNGIPLRVGGGYPERYLFELAIPPHLFGRRVRLSLSTERGMPVGISNLLLDIDGRGNAILAGLNDALRENMSVRADKFIKQGKPASAHVIFQQSVCEELFENSRLAFAAARVAAQVLDTKTAVILLDRVLPSLPGRYKDLSRAGKVLLQLDRYDEARDYFDRAIAMDSLAFDARNGRIKAIIGVQDWRLALLEAHRLRHEVACDTPHYAELSGTIAWLYLNLSEPERAYTEATAALGLHPDNTRLMQMQADALVRLSRYQEAIAIYRRAMVSNPKSPLLRKRVATALMLVREFGEAADEDVGRMQTPTFIKLNNVPEVPLWRGELNLGGKLLVWAEVNFGVGQNLLHGTVLPDLIDLGFDIVLEVEARLVPLFAAAFPQIEVCEQAAPGEERGVWIDSITRHVPIGNLVRYFRRELSDYATSKPYLQNDIARAQRLREELLGKADGARVLVGFSWTSNNPYVGDDKSVPLEELLLALDLPGVALVNLQYGEHADEIAAAERATGVRVLEAAEIDRTDDLVGMCDLIGALDAVVCIGHTTAHLAGGLGTPGLVLVPSSPFSHWLGDGERCVWYPTLRIVRQKTAERGQWGNALAKAREYLALIVLGVELPPLERLPVSDWGTSERDRVAAFCRNALGIAMGEYSYREIEDVLALIEERYPFHPRFHDLVGDCRFRIGEFDGALAAYQAAIEFGGDRIELTRKKIDVLLECYDLARAENLLREMFSADPSLALERPDLAVLEAQILACQGRDMAVIQKLEPIALADPANAEAALTLANAYSAQGEYAKARGVLSDSVAVTGDPETAIALGAVLCKSGLDEIGLQVIEQAQRGGADALGTFWRAQFREAPPAKDSREFRRVELTHPAESGSRVTVFACMDSSYCSQYFGSLVASMRESAPDANLHIHVVNPPESLSRRLEAAKQLMGPDRFSYGTEKVTLTSFSPEERKTYYASIRFVRLAELMRACPGVYFVMDADNVVRGDISRCAGLMSRCDVMIRNRFSLRPHLAVAACGILLADSDAARAFMDRTAAYIMNAFRTREIAWFLDQIALTTAMRGEGLGPPAGLRVAQLPRALLDWDFAEESLVWTGKGRRRLKNARYQSEYLRYKEVFAHALLETA